MYVNTSLMVLWDTSCENLHQHRHDTRKSVSLIIKITLCDEMIPHLYLQRAGVMNNSKFWTHFRGADWNLMFMTIHTLKWSSVCKKEAMHKFQKQFELRNATACAADLFRFMQIIPDSPILVCAIAMLH